MSPKRPGQRPSPSRRELARFAGMSDEELLRDCEVQVFHATGPGGQGVNTADSAVRMRHVPTGIAVTSRETRSQLRNRARCLEKIRAELKRRSRPRKHRVKTKVPRRQRERRLEDKRRRSDVKRLRGRVRGD